ncbi:MAG: decaprenyl-phosphate phosphoribosyltransferase, partial [Acidimicrobiia bacterium]
MADEAPTSTDPAASTRARGVAGARLPTSSPAEMATPKTSTSKIRGFVREARPRQWAKNVLVAAAP